MILVRTDRLLRAIERGFALLAAVSAFVIMVIIVFDVVLRYFFHAPLSWATELIGWFLMVLMFYGALSGAFTNNSHVRVDILLEYCSLPLQRLLETAICLLSAPVFGFIAYLAAARAWQSFANDEVLSGLIAWPTWPPPAFAAIGAGLLTMRLLFNAMAHFNAWATGTDIVALPHIDHSAGVRAE